jgi:hypothetical protein
MAQKESFLVCHHLPEQEGGVLIYWENLSAEKRAIA